VRPKYIIGVILGLLVVYVGIFGLQGFGLRLSLTGTLMKQDCNDLSGWQVAMGNVAVGTGTFVGTWDLTSSSTRSEADLVNPVTWGTQFTVEAKIKVDNWGASDTGQTNFGLVHDETDKVYIFGLYSNRIVVSGQFFNHVTDTGWHIWTWTVDNTLNEIKAYVDGTFLATFATVPITYNIMTYVILSSPNAVPTEAHVDYWYVDSGVHPPGGGGPTTGTLQIYGSSQGSYVSASVTLSGTESHLGNTLADGTALQWTVAAGSYSITGLYNGNPPQSTTVNGITESSWTVVAGTNYQIILNFGGGSPPPPPTDPLAWLKALVNQYRQPIMIFGAIVTLISGIMFVLPYSPKPVYAAVPRP
jgi:hypothetical protein